VAANAYQGASYAKSTALDWITSMTTSTTAKTKSDEAARDGQDGA